MRLAHAIGLGAVLLSASLSCVPADEDRFGDLLPAGAVERLGTLRMRYPSGFADLGYLPGGRGLIAVGRTVQIWDLESARLVDSQTVCEGSIRRMVARPDGSRLLITDSAGNVVEWSLVTQSQVREWPTSQQGLTTAHYSPDGARVLTTGSSPPTIKEWDLATGEELVAVTGRMHYFHEAIYGPEGKTAIVDGGAGASEVLAQYNLSTGEMVHTWLKDYYTHSKSIELSADRKRLLIGSRHSATEWLMDDHKQLKKFSGHHGHAVTAVAYCRNPDELLTGSRDGSIRRWNRLEGKVLLRWAPHERYVTRIVVSPDGKWVLSYGGGTVEETSIDTGQPRIPIERHREAVTSVAALGIDSVVSGSSDGALRIWNIATGKCLRTIAGATLGAYAVATHPKGRAVAAGCKDGVVRLFDTDDGSLLRELKGHLGYVRAVTYTPSGDRLLSAAGDGTVRVWGAGGDEPLSILRGHRGGVLAVAVSPDGRLVAGGGRDGTVRLWELHNGKLLHTLKGHRGWVQAVAFSTDSASVFSGAGDGGIIKWDVAAGRSILSMHHRSAVYCMAVSIDGKMLYAGAADDKISCWDVATGERTRTLGSHGGDVLGLAFSPDGRRLVSASQDTTLLVWRPTDR